MADPVGPSSPSSSNAFSVLTNATTAAASAKSLFSTSVYAKYFDEKIEIIDGKRVTKLTCRWTKLKDPNQKCDEVLTLQGQGYSNLRMHFKRKHDFSIESNRNINAKGRQLTLDDLSSGPGVIMKYNKRHPKQRSFDENVVGMMAVDGRPLNYVTGKGFRKLIHDLDSKIKIKSRNTYKRKINETVRHKVLPEIKKTLKSLEKRFIHFSCDIWTSRQREGILGILCHYINSEWDLKNCVISFKRLSERHTAAYIKTVFEDCLREMDIPKNWGGVLTTDNASNMIHLYDFRYLLPEEDLIPELEPADFPEPESSISDEDDAESEIQDIDESSSDEADEEDERDIETDLNGYDSAEGDFQDQEQQDIQTQLGCMAHTLQLAINTALKNDEYSRTFITYVHSIMAFIKKSTIMSEELKKVCGVDVLLPAVTRWNGTLDMLGRFMRDEFFGAVSSLLDKATRDFRPSKPSTINKKKNPPRSPGPTDQEKAAELFKLLRPLGDATDKLQGDGPTSNWVILSVATACHRLQTTTPEHFGDLKESLLKNLKKRMDPIIKKDEFIVAAMLDPRIKNSLFTLSLNVNNEDSQENQFDPSINIAVPGLEVAMDTLKANFDLEVETGANITVPTSSQGTPTTNRVPIPRSSMFFLLNRSGPERIKKTEIEMYIDEPLEAENSCPLKYWKVNSIRYPGLAKMARKFLSIPATSGGVERLFSVSGAIARSRRARISVNTISNLLLLRQYFNDLQPVKKDKVNRKRQHSDRVEEGH